MYKIFGVYIFSLFFLACNSHISQNKPSLNRFKLSFRMPMQVVNNKGIGDSIDNYITSYKGYKICEFQYHETLENEYQLLYDSVKFEYFIYNPKKNFGYLLKQPTDSFIKKINSDSILTKHGIITKSTDSFYVTNSILKSRDKVFDDGSKTIYRYLYEGFYDSAYLIFDKKLMASEFSICKYEDSIQNNKLSKLMLFIKHDIKQDSVPELKEFYISSYEIKKDTAKNEEDLKKLFDRFIEFDKKQNE